MFSFLTLGSCVKGHSCTCFLNSNPDVVVHNSVIVGTKKAAKKSCDNESSASSDYSCSLK